MVLLWYEGQRIKVTGCKEFFTLNFAVACLLAGKFLLSTNESFKVFSVPGVFILPDGGII